MYFILTNRIKAYILIPFSTNRSKAYILDLVLPTGTEGSRPMRKKKHADLFQRLCKRQG